MTDRTVSVRFRAEVAEAIAGVKSYGKAINDVAIQSEQVGKKGSQGFGDVLGWVNKNEQSLSKLTTQVGLVGAGLTAFAALGVKSFADFDQAMSGVAATGQEARDSIVDLREAALDAGSRTVFSATESANAIENLAKAGISAADILDGALDGALDLAAAGTLDVADAAEIAATTLTQFNLKGDQASHVADVLAAGAGKAQGEVTDMALAMKYAGVPAAQLGVSLEETAGTIALFAKNGIIGEQAGTSLRSMISSLTSPSMAAQKAMDELNISVFDGQDKFIGFEGVAGVLEQRLGTLTDKERSYYLGRIFGNEALQAANVLTDQGAGAIREWTAAVDDQGYAAEVAATRLDNLKGDIEGLRGSIETALISMGEGANGPLRSLVQELDRVVDGFNQLPAPIQQGTLLLAGGGGLALLGIAALGKLLIAVSEAKLAMDALNLTALRTKITMAGLGVAVGLLAFAAAADAIGDYIGRASVARVQTDGLADDLLHLTDRVDEVGPALSDLFSTGASWSPWRNEVKTTQQAVDAFAASAREAFGEDTWDRFDRALDFSGSEVAAFRKQAEQLDGALSHMVEAGQAEAAADALKKFTDGAVDQGVPLEKLTELFPLYNDAVAGSVTPQAEADAAARQLANTMGYTGEMTEEAAKALEEWRAGVAEADASFINLDAAYQGVIDKNREVAESSADATKTSKDSWEDFYDGVSVSADDYIAQLQAQVDAQNAWETNMLDITARVRDGMTGDMADAANAMIDELLTLGPEGAAQVQLLHDMTDEQFAKVVALWSEKGTSAVTEFTNKVEEYRNPVVDIEADLTTADMQVRAFLQTQRVMTIDVRATLPDLNGPASGTGRMGSYDGGGYTGAGGKLEPAGVVHRGEFVFDQETTAANRGAFEQIHRTGRMPQYDKGGFVDGYATAGLRLPGYAAGGFAVAVNAQYAASVAPTIRASSGRGGDGDAPIIGSLQVYGYDPQDAVREFGREVTWSMAGGRP